MDETCILCRKGVDTGQRYYVRTDVKAVITDLLRKIPRNLAHLFDFHPSMSTTCSVGVPFCCRPCKRLLEKRQKLVDNIDVVEKEMRNKRLGQAARSLDLESSSTSHVNPSATCTSSPFPSSSGNQFHCELSPIAAPRSTTYTSLISNQSLTEGSGSLSQPNRELGVKVWICFLFNFSKLKRKHSNFSSRLNFVSSVFLIVLLLIPRTSRFCEAIFVSPGSWSGWTIIYILCSNFFYLCFVYLHLSFYFHKES